MGLDMYLNKLPKVKGYTFDDLVKWEEELFEDTEVLPEDLHRYVRRFGPHSNWLALNERVGYWRKANQIHNWFVENIQYGEDECIPHLVSREALVALLEDLRTVIKARLEDEDESEAVALKLLPTQSGFFYGSTEYDDYYFEQLLETHELLEKVIKETDFGKEYLYYRSSW